MTLLCGQCETRLVHLAPCGRMRSRCKPCERAAAALATYWLHRGMGLSWRPRNPRATLFAIRVAA